MLDRITVTPRTFRDLGKAAQQRSIRFLSGDVLEGGTLAAIDVLPNPDRSTPHRPFLHCGDWVDDGNGTLWTVLTALLHEDDDDEGEPYLWHEYEVVQGMHCVV